MLDSELDTLTQQAVHTRIHIETSKDQNLGPHFVMPEPQPNVHTAPLLRKNTSKFYLKNLSLILLQKKSLFCLELNKLL